MRIWSLNAWVKSLKNTAWVDGVKNSGEQNWECVNNCVTNNFRIKEKNGLKISREARVNPFLGNKCCSYCGQVICNQKIYFVKCGVFMEKKNQQTSGIPLGFLAHLRYSNCEYLWPNTTCFSQILNKLEVSHFCTQALPGLLYVHTAIEM